jgi:cytosine/uracil/thiamine/allantoin permease
MLAEWSGWRTGMEAEEALLDEGMESSVICPSTRDDLPGAVKTELTVMSFVIVWKIVLVVPVFSCQQIDKLHAYKGCSPGSVTTDVKVVVSSL